MPTSCRATIAITSRAGFSLIDMLVVITIISVLAAMLLPSIGMVRNQARQISCLSSLRQLGIGVEAYASDWGGVVVPIQNPGQQLWYTLIGDLLGTKTVTNISNRSAGGVVWGCPAWRNRIGAGGVFQPTSSGYALNSWLDKINGDTTRTNHNNLYYPTWSFWGPGRMFNMASLSYPSSRALLVDSNDWHTHGENATRPAQSVNPDWTLNGRRHGDKGNVVFCDLHAKSIPLARMNAALLNPGSLE